MSLCGLFSAVVSSSGKGGWIWVLKMVPEGTIKVLSSLLLSTHHS